MKKRIELIIRVNKQAGSEEFYKKSQDLGMLAAQSFREEQGRERQQRHRAQMTGLENIAETTLKVTDVLDYVKKQTARQKGWQKEVGANKERFGERLKKCIESELKTFVDNVCNGFIEGTTDEGKQERQEAYLQLVRQLIRQIVVQYEYQVSQVAERARP
ncbi:MAG: hypothetical protein ACJ8BW_20280 [Ktedonobacteraceae bacterium]